ncbi:hypothetical protein F511_18011 [Dorcoceras hygrometricum]|uniref:Uncharacterized protein n=1 Tax=Dorcoceras hygrometricum TaxID=472368 RepID=A0A2Z7DAN8_9LAMI|nr:hypothetical protein F511_18011 [Dorcoceras hygrometricum]
MRQSVAQPWARRAAIVRQAMRSDAALLHTPAASLRPTPSPRATNDATTGARAASRASAVMEDRTDGVAYTSHRPSLLSRNNERDSRNRWPKKRPALGSQARRARYDRAHMCARKGEGRRHERRRRGGMQNFDLQSEISRLDTIWHTVLIRSENLALIPLLGSQRWIWITPPGEATEE